MRSICVVWLRRMSPEALGKGTTGLHVGLHTGRDKPGKRPGAGIHSEKFGYVLREEMEKLEIPCEVVVGRGGGRPDKLVEFLVKHFK